MPNEGYNVATDQNDHWRTPAWLFKALDMEFAFECDAACDATNQLCEHSGIGNIDEMGATLWDRYFCNPPYSNIEPFVDAALANPSTLWAFILPVRTRSAWFERLRNSPRVEFRWLRKRIAFDPPPGVEPSSPRMDTFIAIVRPIA